jgi:hypothetical protein
MNKNLKNLKTRKMCQISYLDQLGMIKSYDRSLECKDMSISSVIEQFISKGYPIPTFKVTEYDEVTYHESEKKFCCNYRLPTGSNWTGLTFFDNVKNCNYWEFSAFSDILCSLESLPNGTEFKIYSIENGLHCLLQSGTFNKPQAPKKEFNIYIRTIHHSLWEKLVTFLGDENTDALSLLLIISGHVNKLAKDTQYKVLDVNGALVLSGCNT